MLNTFKIKIGINPHDTMIEMNGAPLHGVCRVAFNLDSREEATPLTLQIYGEVLVEGAFVERTIVEAETMIAAPQEGGGSKVQGA